MKCKEKTEKKIPHTHRIDVPHSPLLLHTPSTEVVNVQTNEKEKERIYLYIGEGECGCDDLKKRKENERKDERYFYERKKGILQ